MNNNEKTEKEFIEWHLKNIQRNREIPRFDINDYSGSASVIETIMCLLLFVFGFIVIIITLFCI